MDDFFPFIYEIEKKKEEPLPLYIELIPPTLQPEPDEYDDETPRVIIIEL